MNHVFSDLSFDPPAPTRICRVVDGHDIVIEHFLECDGGDWWGSLDLKCDGKTIHFTQAEYDVVHEHWHANYFDTDELAEVLANALVRHLAGKAVQ